MVVKMKEFKYQELEGQRYDVDIVNLLAAIHEYRGKQALFVRQNPEVLEKLTEVAMIQSTDASNKIEGIYTTDERLRDIVQHKTKPRTRNEKEISGYRDVLALIHESYGFIEIKSSNILTLHGRLYTYLENNFAGKWKNTDNFIEEVDGDGNKFVRFKPAPAVLTPNLIDQLVYEFQQVINDGLIDPLLAIPAFIFDFLSIHPFRDGNGRMSRLLTILLLYRAGYMVGKYISLEMIIENSKESYYDALRESSIDWWDNKQDYAPFMRYFLGVVYKAYTDFEKRFVAVRADKLSGKERVEQLLQENIVPLSRHDIMNLLPDMSESSVRRSLTELVEEGWITKLGKARATKYQAK